MGTTVRVSIARVSANALVAAALCTLVAGVGAASASATPFPAECSNLQMAINEVAGATQHGEGDVIVLNGMCDAANLASPTGVTLPAGSSFSIEGKSGTTSGFDGTDVTGPLLGNVPSTEAGAMTLGHLTFQHAKNVSALSIRASRVTLSDDSFLENEEQGGSEHAAFVDVGQSPANCPPPTGPAAITVTDSTFLRNKLVLGSGRGGGGAAWLEDTCEPSRNVLEGNIFEGNTLEAAGTAGEVEVTGGGLQFVGAKKQPTPVSQSGNVFDSNGIVAKESAEGNYGGGGEWLQDASLSSVGDRFSRNMIAGTSSHEESAWSWGAGLGIDNFDLDCSAALPESTLEDVVVTGNAIGPGYTEALGGGGIYVGCTHLRVLDSTFTLNTAPAGAGIEGESNDQLELANSIVAEDSGGNEIAGFNKPAAGGSLIATYSDVCSYAGSSEPVPGTGNICANPLLADNGEPVSFDVHETASSPTIDAGSNALVPDGLTTDFYGTPRILAGYASCSQSFPAVVDMGAAEPPARPAVLPSCCPAADQSRAAGARADPLRQPRAQLHRHRAATELHEHRRSGLLRDDLRHLQRDAKGQEDRRRRHERPRQDARQNRPRVVLPTRRRHRNVPGQAQLDRPRAAAQVPRLLGLGIGQRGDAQQQPGHLPPAYDAVQRAQAEAQEVKAAQGKNTPRVGAEPHRRTKASVGPDGADQVYRLTPSPRISRACAGVATGLPIASHRAFARLTSWALDSACSPGAV